MTPREELSTFLATRGDNLFFSRRLLGAHRAYQAAVELSPRNYGASLSYKRTSALLDQLRTEAQIEAVLRRQDQRLRSDPRVMIPGLPSPPSAVPNTVRPPGLERRMVPRGPQGVPVVPAFGPLPFGNGPGLPRPMSMSTDPMEATRRQNQELIEEAQEALSRQPATVQQIVPPGPGPNDGEEP